MCEALRNTPRHILVVEDHPDTRNAMARLLRFSGYQVSTAGSLREVVNAAEDMSVDLVLCDLTLPDGNGADVMRELGRRSRSVPAIAVTGHTDGPDFAAAERAGFMLRLVKPVELSVLLAAIEDVTSRGFPRPPAIYSSQPV